MQGALEIIVWKSIRHKQSELLVLARHRGQYRFRGIMIPNHSDTTWPTAANIGAKSSCSIWDWHCVGREREIRAYAFNKIVLPSPPGCPNLHAANEFGAKHVSKDAILDKGHDALLHLAVIWTCGSAQSYELQKIGCTETFTKLFVRFTCIHNDPISYEADVVVQAD